MRKIIVLFLLALYVNIALAGVVESKPKMPKSILAVTLDCDNEFLEKYLERMANDGYVMRSIRYASFELEYNTVELLFEKY